MFRSVFRILVTAALRHLSKARRIIAFATLRAAAASPPLSRGMSAALAATKQSYCPPASKNGRVCPTSGYSREHDGESRLRRGAAAHGSGLGRQNGGSGTAQSRRYRPHGARPHSESTADYTTRNCKGKLDTPRRRRHRSVPHSPNDPTATMVCSREWRPPRVGAFFLNISGRRRLPAPRTAKSRLRLIDSLTGTLRQARTCPSYATSPPRPGSSDP